MVARIAPEDDIAILLDPSVRPGSVGDDAVLLESEDGGAEVVFNPQPEAIDPSLAPHDANLAELLDETELDGIASELLEALDEDWSSAAPYRKIVKDGMKYLGLTYEVRSQPFQDACGAYDALLMEAIVRFQATYRGEMLPAGGPVLTQIIGEETEEIENQASRVKDWFNYFLTEIATEYYPDTDRMAFALGCWGSIFRKVYIDPRLGRPTLPFLTPEHFIVSYTTTSLQQCPRSCELIPYTPREMIALQLKGFYREVPLAEPDEEAQIGMASPPKHDQLIGIVQELARGDDRHWVGEFHVDYDLPRFRHTLDGQPTGMPLPYIVAVDLYSRKILSIRRNWEEGDQNFTRVQHYVHHMMIPGDGFYGYGYVHLLGGAARASTMMLRQNVDAGTLALFPGGVRIKGVRTENSEILVGPGQFAELETGGLPIRDAIMPMPYSGPSEVSMQLRDKLREEARSLAANAEIAVGDGRQDAPVGTTVALLEQATKVQSAIMKRERAALRDEFRLLGRIFAQSLPDAPYPFPVRGGQAAIMRTDFSDRIDVVPVADPNISNSAQRQLRAEVVLRLATGMPQAGWDQREVVAGLMRELQVQNIDRVLPPPPQAQALDPVSENQLMMMGKPVTTAPYEDHSRQPHSGSPGGARSYRRIGACADAFCRKVPFGYRNGLGPTAAAAGPEIASTDRKRNRFPRRAGRPGDETADGAPTGPRRHGPGGRGDGAGQGGHGESAPKGGGRCRQDQRGHAEIGARFRRQGGGYQGAQRYCQAQCVRRFGGQRKAGARRRRPSVGEIGKQPSTQVAGFLAEVL